MILTGLLLPFCGTSLGAAAVLLMKRTISDNAHKALLGFASGVMLAASVWSLLLPSVEMAQGSRFPFLPAALGFLAGMAFLRLCDILLTRLNSPKMQAITGTAKAKKTAMTVLAVTLHNIPEGMAVGVAIAAALDSRTGMTAAAATVLAVGIAVQNLPEGAIISLPLKAEGMSKGKAFLYGALSGAPEPLFCALTLLLTGAVTAMLPYLLSFAAGAMVCVVTEDLIPEAQQDGCSLSATGGVAVGFVTMMITDVAFG